jgi:hypothetical protein
LIAIGRDDTPARQARRAGYLVHDTPHQQQSAAAAAEQAFGRSGIRDARRVEAGTVVADRDREQIAVEIDGDRDAPPGIALVAVLDRVGEGLADRQRDSIARQRVDVLGRQELGEHRVEPCHALVHAGERQPELPARARRRLGPGR